MISKGLSALGPVTAGGPDANATITVIPTAKIPHKRRKSKGFLLGYMVLKDWLRWSGKLVEAGTRSADGLGLALTLALGNKVPLTVASHPKRPWRFPPA